MVSSRHHHSVFSKKEVDCVRMLCSVEVDGKSFQFSACTGRSVVQYRDYIAAGGGYICLRFYWKLANEKRSDLRFLPVSHGVY